MLTEEVRNTNKLKVIIKKKLIGSFMPTRKSILGLTTRDKWSEDVWTAKISKDILSF